MKRKEYRQPGITVCEIETSHSLMVVKSPLGIIYNPDGSSGGADADPGGESLVLGRRGTWGDLWE